MPTAQDGYVAVANLEVTAVRPKSNGFQLQGTGADAADYLLEMQLDMPIDERTRRVLAELLSQSEWQVYRRATTPLRSRARRARTRTEVKER